MFSKLKAARKKGQQGIALLMVLASIALLSAMVVEFAYNSHISYSMARNNLDRLKAYYLARSGLEFAKLQVKIEKDIRQQLSKYAKYLEGVVGSEPICQLMPFSTGLLRGFVPSTAGEAEGEPGGTEEGAKEGEGEGEEAEMELGFEGIMAAAAAGDFLSFEGDFSVSCNVEDSKINVNHFRNLKPNAPIHENDKINPYEHHKRLVESLLVSPQYNKIFGKEPEKRRQLVNNIADWVDKNTLVDEQPGVQGGYEDQYYRDAPYTVKNGKFSTPGELLLVAGMNDDIFDKLAWNITIYGDDKVNVCLGDDELVKAFVIRYSNSSRELDPILPDNEELLTLVLAAVREACLTPLPKPNEVANAIREILGLPRESVAASSGRGRAGSRRRRTTGDDEESERGEEEGEAEEGPPPLKSLTEQIVTENRYYSFDLTGSSGDIILRIKAIMNTEDKDPEKWQTLFYKVQ